MRLVNCRFLLAVSLLTALPAAVHAQWSSDPANNLVVSDRDNEQVQAKIVPTADGGFYISWFDNADGGYDVYLQRVDAGGNEQWAHNGVLVADRDFSSTQDYGLDIDADGNALLAYRFNVSGIAQTVAQKVAPDGTLLWPSPGVIVSDDSGDTNAPKISAAGDGSVLVAWSSSEGSVAVQKLDGDGNALWGASGITIDPTTGIFFMSDLHGDADGNAIVSWVPYIGQSHELWAQKLAAADGSNLWGTDPVEVFDGSGGALQFGNFPYFIPDGSGGAVFVWYTVGATGEVRAQHVMSDGTQAFAQNGALASTDDSQDHFEPDGAYDSASGDIYALWRETDVLTQGQIGVYAQRFDSTGARQWGDAGLVLAPLSSLDEFEMTALAVPDGGMIAAWASGTVAGTDTLHAARLDTDGNYVWASQIVDFSTEPTDTARLAGAVSTEGFFAYAWTASTEEFSGDLHAQNINPDGTLGVPILDRLFANGFDP